MTLTNRGLAVVALILGPFVVSQCMCSIAVNELLYRPSPSDPYYIWNGYVTDSGLLLLCGHVDNGAEESVNRVSRVYNVELRLEETLDPQQSEALQVVEISKDPTLRLTKGYLSDLCQFDEKRPTKRPDEAGWTDVFLASWDEGFAKINHADIEAGRLPTPPAEPRVVIYNVEDSDPPEYLLMGQLREGGPKWKVLLILGSEVIEAMW